MTENRKGIVALLLIISLFLPYSTIVFSLQSYTATVNITVKPVYYPHRDDVSGLTPSGKLMNTTKPPSGQSETTYQIIRGSSVYFYTPALSGGSIQSELWKLYIWASTASSGKSSQLTVQIHLVSSDGSIIKATIGSIANIAIDYDYAERVITVAGSAVTITSGDRIRLMLLSQTGATNDPSGIIFYYDGYGTYETQGHETRLRPP